MPNEVEAPELWTPETVTARDLVSDSAVTVLVTCEGCRTYREMNIWKVGARLADDYLYRLRFRCRTCGMYPTMMEIRRRNSSSGEKLFKIALRPAAWDEGMTKLNGWRLNARTCAGRIVRRCRRGRRGR